MNALINISQHNPSYNQNRLVAAPAHIGQVTFDNG